MPATGKGGRITKEDLLAYIAQGQSTTSLQEQAIRREPPIATIPTAHLWNTSPTSQPMTSQLEDTVVEIKGITKVMVKTMTAAQQVPRFTYHDEYTMDNIVL